MTATEGGHFNAQRRSVTYIFTGETWLATHCHLPPGIFTQVSVQRTCSSTGFPDASEPLDLEPPVAIAVSPNTVTLTSSYSMLEYLVAFASASSSALPVIFPSTPVPTNLSAISGATSSGLFVFCD